MQDILGRDLKLGDLVLRMNCVDLNAYAIVAGENELATCKFFKDKNGISVYNNSYKLLKAKDDSIVYKLSVLNNTEKAIYNTIKEFQNENLKSKIKEKEDRKVLSKSIIPGDVVTLNESNNKNTYLYLGKGVITVSDIHKKEVTSKEEGYIYIRLLDYNVLTLVNNNSSLSSIDSIKNFLDTTSHYRSYTRGVSGFISHILKYRCLSRMSSLVTKKLGHLDLICNEYSYITGSFEYKISLLV